ncbi:MAG: HD domain-containing phosphohydrolase [Longibaculum sp.]
MKLIKSREVIQIVRNMLNLIDVRLVHHGERVTFLCVKILEHLHYSQEDIYLCAKLALFHDIGAYKTDEIDNMLTFESHDVWEHAIYGYLFLSRLSPLAAYADCVLFHHLDYEKLLTVDCSQLEMTSLIHMCDRIDVLLQSGIMVDQQFFDKTVDKKFMKKFVDAFYELDQNHHLLQQLVNHQYHKDIDELFESYTFTDDEKFMYLCMMAYSIDFSSEFTVVHTIMTTSLAVEIAKFCGMNDLEIEKIYYGALLHDIGKAAIPISILEKPGKLTEEETRIMQTHVEISEEVLKGHLPDDVLQIAIRHHEKLDGSGYPRGLCKDDLTLSECIVAVADILSALLGKRSYKSELSIEQAIEIVQDMANKGLISKEVVSVFVDNHQQIIKNVKDNSKEIQQIYLAMNEDYVSIYKRLEEYNLL